MIAFIDFIHLDIFLKQKSLPNKQPCLLRRGDWLTIAVPPLFKLPSRAISYPVNTLHTERNNGPTRLTSFH